MTLANTQTLIGGGLCLVIREDGSLHALDIASSRQSLVVARPAGYPLWRLWLRDATGGERVVAAVEAQRTNISLQGQTLHLIWEELPIAPELQVKATITAETDALHWHLTVNGLHPETALWQVDFPILPSITLPASSGEAQWLMPRAGGYVVRDPDRAILQNNAIGRRVVLTHPGSMTMQFLAYYREGAQGLWLGTQDRDGYVKQFIVAANDRGWELYVRHLPPGQPYRRDSYAIPYPVIAAVCPGHWSQAAERYRTWAIQQPWCGRGPLLTRHDLPRWLLETGLWLWNRGPSSRVIPGALALQEIIKAPVALDWYWWHQTPYDTHYPDYLPPREGTQKFQEAIQMLHAARLRAIVYINGRLWGMGAPSWSAHRAWEAACKQEDGSLYREIYNVFNGAEMTPMCPTTPLWQETLREIVAELINHYQADGVYIDQIGIASPRPCFDTSHGHSLGGGNHWATGYRELITRIREAIANQMDVMIPTEGCCDTYLDLFDAFLVLDNSFERMGFYDAIGLSWEPVPLFAAVYHDYAVHFGSYASLAPPPYDDRWPMGARPPRSSRYRERDFVGAFHAELGRAFVAGAQPMVANFYPEQASDPELQPCWRFLRDLVHTRLQAAPFLLYGRWLPPPKLEVPEIEVDFLVRGIYTPPDQEHIITRHMPAVLASRWLSADGRIGLALANISGRDQPIRWDEDEATPGQPVYRIDGERRLPIGVTRRKGTIYEGEIPARSVQVIELGRRSEGH